MRENRARRESERQRQQGEREALRGAGEEAKRREREKETRKRQQARRQEEMVQQEMVTLRRIMEEKRGLERLVRQRYGVQSNHRPAPRRLAPEQRREGVREGGTAVSEFENPWIKGSKPVF